MYADPIIRFKQLPYLLRKLNNKPLFFFLDKKKYSIEDTLKM